jgi:hypothetical protein
VFVLGVGINKGLGIVRRGRVRTALVRGFHFKVCP